MYGSMGALTAQNREIVSNSPDELRSMIRSGRKQAATTRITATSPWTGTHLIASYQWTDTHRWAMPGHLYSTQAIGPMPGLNVYIRQPIPGLSMLPWRMEATADLRNMLPRPDSSGRVLPSEYAALSRRSALALVQPGKRSYGPPRFLLGDAQIVKAL
jgi:hypothetical protein